MSSEQIMQEKSLHELVSALKDHLPGLDYRQCSIDRLDAVWIDLIRYCEARGVTVFTMELGRRFVWERYGSRLGDTDASHNVNRAIHMLADFQRYGMVFKQSSATLKGFSDAYKPLFEGFLALLCKNGMAKGSIGTWKSRLFRFEYFLNSSGLTDFSQMELHHVNTYVESLAGFSTSTVAATIGNFKRLFDYAFENGYHHKNFSDVLPNIRRTKKYRLPAVFTADEVERILNGVDRDNALGKRNYAIFMLVAKLGLRISDARLLTFDSIDWQNKIISINQKKTGVPLDLPLLEDIGWAIIDYLKHGRPTTDCENIFVRHSAPYNTMTGNLQRIVLEAVQEAGVKTPANKPIGMHTFRHSVATTMLANGAKLTDIAQTLGHAAPESTQTYISLDAELLRQCALEVSI